MNYKFNINEKVKYYDLIGTIIDCKKEIFGSEEYNLYLVKYEDDNQYWAFENSLLKIVNEVLGDKE